MPNHIQCRLQFIAAPEKVEEVRNFIKGNFGDETPMTIDFNKIKKAPESLNMSIHSGIEDMAKNALNLPTHKNDLIGVLEMQSRRQAKSPITLNDEEWVMFITCLNNFRLYGHMYWYSWNIENWGTKWNAYEQNDSRDTTNTIHFQTAWNAPTELMHELHKLFPDVKMIFTYADEDSGSNTGVVTFESGEMTKHNPISQSKEAYDLYFELHPDSLEYYELVDGEYKYKEED